MSNNEAEYEACTIGLEAALELGAIRFNVIGDLYLVASQAIGDWKGKEEMIKVYHQTLDVLILRLHIY